MSFSRIYGHEKQTAALQKAIGQKRVGHAYLFSGIDSIGKKTLAVEFAKTLNCEGRNDASDACDKCSSCLKIEHANHPDMIFIEAEGQFIRIGAIREIQEQMKFKPVEGRWRAVIIDDADKMNDQAANALLKTLEEPSASNILILISSRPYSLPATIISRTRHMRYNPLPSATVARFLNERKGMDTEKAGLLAGLSGGSIGKALELDSEDTAGSRAEIMQILVSAGKNDPLSMLALASFFSQDKKKIRQELNIIRSCFRDALIYRETKKNGMLINRDNFSFIEKLAQKLSGEEILHNISLLEKAEEAMEQNVNKTLTLETMAFKLNV